MKPQGYNLGSRRLMATNKTEREALGELTVIPIRFSHTFCYASGKGSAFTSRLTPKLPQCCDGNTEVLQVSSLTRSCFNFISPLRNQELCRSFAQSHPSQLLVKQGQWQGHFCQCLGAMLNVLRKIIIQEHGVINCLQNQSVWNKIIIRKCCCSFYVIANCT